MATDHRGNPMHAGKRTDDEMHEQIKKYTNGIIGGYGPYQQSAPSDPYPKIDKPSKIGSPKSQLMPDKKMPSEYYKQEPSEYYKQDMSKNVNYPNGKSTPDGY
ncbi:hypothetical protein UFOVP629_99 [uncultured Caudovirales phage]|uniref:Uncharacterized protein n=1 Tax=uncultured Caudovirales phage TaxID=2100421 RepID=A0A6J5NBE6_9CAUD|nr:hypothetical protein UFOVP629_99 [uncultured Caudovirales phage]